jgi:hypothetical protein
MSKLNGKKAFSRLEIIMDKSVEEQKARLEALLVGCRVSEIEDPVARKREEQEIAKRFWAVESKDAVQKFAKLMSEEKELRSFIDSDRGFISILKEIFRSKKK